MHNFKCAKVISLYPHVEKRDTANNNPLNILEWGRGKVGIATIINSDGASLGKRKHFFKVGL